MAQAKQGDTVRLHYTGRLRDGSTFDSSEGSAPLEFRVGMGEVIPGFDRAVIGMQAGEQKTVEVAAVDAYGERNEELQSEVPRTDIPSDLELEVGEQLQASLPDGRTILVTVREVRDDTVRFDLNHPLAGEDLIFDIELVEVISV